MEQQDFLGILDWGTYLSNGLLAIMAYWILHSAFKLKNFNYETGPEDELGSELKKSAGEMADHYSMFLLLVSTGSLQLYNELHGKIGQPLTALNPSLMMIYVIAIALIFVLIIYLQFKFSPWVIRKYGGKAYYPVPVKKYLFALAVGILWVGLANGSFRDSQISYASQCFVAVILPSMVFRMVVRSWIFKQYIG